MLVRDRAIKRSEGESFLNHLMADDLIERLSLVKRSFEHCLIVGSAPEALHSYLRSQKIQSVPVNGINSKVECDEDRLPFADSSFDLVLCVGSLDTVNDLPGALILIRRILQQDGLFLAAFPGAESLPLLKSLLMTAEGDRVAPHIHPQIDVRTLGDLMMRADFALPVIDNQQLQLRYNAFEDLLRDIRDYGGSNVMGGHAKPIAKYVYSQTKDEFAANADGEGKTIETIEILYICGWAPHPDQPKPAARGSGQVSLHTALGSGAGSRESDEQRY